jgi:hypothetical protein
MFRPIVKNAARLGLFVAAVATVACTGVTSPDNQVNIKKRALKDTIVIEGDTSDFCRSGWHVINGRWTCGDVG